jgi:hypothetical protein
VKRPHGIPRARWETNIKNGIECVRRIVWTELFEEHGKCFGFITNGESLDRLSNC